MESKDIKSEINVTCLKKTVISRQFPLAFEAGKKRDYYPAKPDNFSGDILEIGPGRGDLLLTLAEQSPSKQFIAIELSKKRHFRMIPRIEKKNLRNILLIRGDVRVVLSENFKKESFEIIFILFPDPWPKKRHAFKRLLTVDFIRLLVTYLKPGGLLILGTDVESYAYWVEENMRQLGAIDQSPLQNALAPNRFAERLPELTPTYFEEKWRKEGKKIFFMKYRKQGQ